jgi:hypothetical protein
MRATDGGAITNPENAHNFSHGEIKKASEQMNPAGLDGAFDAWSAIAAAVTKAGEQFETAIQQAVDHHWQGAAADKAVAAIRDYATRMNELGQSLDQQSQPLSAASAAAARFKAAVPDVAEGSGAQGDPQTRNTAEEQARDDMNTLYIQPYGATAPEIPTLPPPVHPIAAQPGNTGGMDAGIGPGRPNVVDTDPSHTGTQNQNQPGGHSQPDEQNHPGQQSKPGELRQPTDQSKPSENGQPTEPSTPGEHGEPTEQSKPGEAGKPEAAAPQPVSPASTQNNGAPTAPASTTHPTTLSAHWASSTAQPLATATSTAPTAVTPVSLDSPASRPGIPSPPGPAPSYAGEPRPGTSFPAQPGATPGTPGAQPVSGAPNRTGAVNAAGYSGGTPPRVRRGGADDDEHDSPDYLRSAEHGTELIGTVEPTVPPVLGAE